MAERQWVFICGCSRSGTSATALLLRSHPNVAMGTERYASRLRSQKYLTPDLFEKDRFCRNRIDGDSHQNHLNWYYDQLYQRFDDCTHIGDKIPDMHPHFAAMRENFPGAKFLFMLRHVQPVANSFEVRSLEAGPERAWPANRDGFVAVNEWNQSMRDVEAAMTSDDIRVVDYDRLFKSDDLLREILGFLSLELTPDVRAFWRKGVRKRRVIDGKVRNSLSAAHLANIEKNADLDMYKRLLAASENQAASSTQARR